MSDFPLVVGIDGSESSLRAADWAADEARLREVPLRLVYASLWHRYEGSAPAGGTARAEGQMPADIVEAAAERVRRRTPDVELETRVLPDDAIDGLLREGGQACALVTGSRGRGGITGLLLGSVSLAVAAGAHSPVVVVRGDESGLDGTHGRIVLGIGDADVDSAAVRFAFDEARLRGCELDVVRAWRCPSHETADHPVLAGDPDRYHEERASAVLEEALHAAVIDHPEVKVRRETVEGPAHKILLARSAVADLLVIGARRHGRTGMRLSRVAHTTLRHASCPVAVVPVTP